jgi:hypothetical protein
VAPIRQNSEVATLDIGWRRIGVQFGKHGVDAAFDEVLRRCQQLDGVQVAEAGALFQVHLELLQPLALDSVVSKLQRDLDDSPVQATIGGRVCQIYATVAAAAKDS